MLKKLIDYLVQDLGVQPNVAVTIILTLFTFSLGFIITWLAAAISKWIKRINYKKILKIIIRNFLESCKKQYLLLEKFSNHKGFLHGEDYSIQIKSDFGQNYLGSLDIKVFIENFASIFKKNRAQAILDLFEIIEIIRFTKETSQEQIKIYHLDYEKNLKIYNENIDGLKNIVNDLALEYNGQTVEKSLGDYISSIALVFTNWEQQKRDATISITNDEIVTPLFEKALLVPPNPISRKVIFNCSKCRDAVEDIRRVEGRIKEEINRLKDVHKDAHERGIPILNKL